MKSDHLIFREPPDDVDETWAHGAMLGGMCGYDDQSLARSYFMAGAALVKHVLSEKERGQELVCPILYLYRHGIELYLKVIVDPAVRNHSLGALLEAFCRYIRERYDEQVPVWITRPITQLAEFDPGSDLFRYGQTVRSSPSRRLAEEGEFWVDLRQLKRTMSQLEYAFMRAIVADAQGLEDLDQIVPPPRSI